MLPVVGEERISGVNGRGPQAAGVQMRVDDRGQGSCVWGGRGPTVMVWGSSGSVWRGSGDEDKGELYMKSWFLISKMLSHSLHLTDYIHGGSVQSCSFGLSTHSVK